MAEIVIAGGGLIGLPAALLLARRGHRVTIVERDPPDVPATPSDAWNDWRRPGVAQVRQFHGFTALGRNVLRDHLPDVLDAARAHGASEVDLVADFRRADPDLEPVAGDDELVVLRCRRTTLEPILRGAALAEPGVSWTRSMASGLVTDGERVVGLRTADGDVGADLVVDATGRRAHSSSWVRDAGLGAGVVHRQPTGIVYFTRWYRRSEGSRVPGGAGARQDLDSVRLAVFPYEDNVISLAFMADADDPALRQLRDVEVFQRVAEHVPNIARWITPDVATPITDVLFMGGLEDARWDPDVDGLVALGDASRCTNPFFARGFALGAAAALALADALDGSNPEAAYRSWLATNVDRWLDDAVARDRARSTWLKEVRGEPLTDDERKLLETDDVRVLRAMPAVTATDIRALYLFVRYVQSFGTPADLFDDPEIRAAALALDESPTSPLPRDELLALL